MAKLEMLKMFIDQNYPPKPKFSEDDVPDLSGKVILITGGNAGVGEELARVVLAHNAKTYIACRSKDKAEAAIDRLKKKTGKTDIHFIKLDLSNFESVREAAEHFKEKETKLDVLFNNAGVMSTPIEQLTQDGYDMQFGTNVVGPFLFTQLLLPLLQKTAEATGDARVVWTSSLGHAAAPKEYITWETLKPGDRDTFGDEKRREMGTDVLYYQSKCGVIMVANELAKRHGKQGIVSVSLHPGTVQSELGRHWSRAKRLAMGLFIPLKPTSYGAISALYAGTSPQGKDLNGAYLIPYARVGKPRSDVLDEANQEKLWTWLEEQVQEVSWKAFNIPPQSPLSDDVMSAVNGFGEHPSAAPADTSF